MHLAIDGYEADYTKLADRDWVYAFLDTYPDVIGMTKIGTPNVYTYTGSKPEDWGVSGFVVIAESHISVHTFPERGYVNIDVFSCLEFDAGKALQEITETFSLGLTRSWVLDRGLEYADPERVRLSGTAQRTRL